jgi:hypothetical protein
VTPPTHNYDMGSLYIEDDGVWRLIAPTEPGPQPHGTGGEIALWASHDQGKPGTRVRQLTTRSPRNHGYVRRPIHAHPDFYAFWADGNTDTMSESPLYFTNQTGTTVRRLPHTMTTPHATP